MPKTNRDSIFRPLHLGRQEIRLACIKPSAIADAKIECELVTVSLHTRPTLEALSYFWGDPNATVLIILNGVEWQVPVSLWQCLRRLRSEDRERLIWVDNMCINQTDPDERAAQIGLMHEIYRGATQVVIWLGDCEPDGQDAALQTLEYLSNGTRWIELFPNLEDTQGATNDTSKCVEGLSMIGDEYLEPPIDQLSKLLNSEWWERLWTLQEIVLAEEIQFQWGGRAFGWSFLELAELTLRKEAASNIAELASIFDNFEDFFNLLTQRVREIQDFKTQQNSVWHRAALADEEWLFSIFASALARCRYRSSMDHRDKIFGLLGLFPDTVRLAIKPSYQQPVQEIFLRTAFLILQKTRSYLIFNHVIMTQDSDLEVNCPSWVPSWHHWSRHYEDDEFRIAQRRIFSASGQSPFSVTKDAHGVLCVSAIRVDKVSALFQDIQLEDPIGFRGNFEGRWLDALGKWNEKNKFVLGPNDEICNRILGPIAINGCAPCKTHSVLSKADAVDLLDIERWLEMYPSGGASNEEFLRSTFTNLPSANIFNHVKSAVVGRALFVTDMGYVGTLSGENAFHAATKGIDLQLFILAGGTHPVVLSPAASRNPSAYEVVGEAFVPPIMHGEIVFGDRPVAGNVPPSWKQIYIA